MHFISGQFRKEEREKKGAKRFFSPVASRHLDLQPFRSQQSRRLTQMLPRRFGVEHRVSSTMRDVDKNNRSRRGCVPGTVVVFLWRPTSVITLRLILPGLPEPPPCTFKGFSKANCPARRRRLIPDARWAHLRGDGGTSKNPIRIREATLSLSTRCGAPLILPSLLLDVF